uniref:Glycine-rich protein n=1 Tax=Setaria digitata TaxID=48799 RepID=A0A915PPE5_9BILA
MPYIDSSGNIVESKKSMFDFLWRFFMLFLYFFQTLLGPLLGQADVSSSNRSSSRRRHGWSGNDRWPGSGGPGPPGPRRGGHGYGQRPVGRLAFSSGMSCPPMGGGS